MINSLLNHLAPHYCCHCGQIGVILCDYCKYNIESEAFEGCILCGHLSDRRNICVGCSVPYRRAWCVGEHADGLRTLIGEYKFGHVRDAYRPLADMLLGQMGQLPAQTIVVPVPTVRSHVRERGYDHTLLVARHIAKVRGLQLEQPLKRATTTKQRGATRERRLENAKNAFLVKKSLSADVPYLLVDDVVTTGATLYYAAKALKAAGADEVWAAVIARQTLD